MFFDDLLSSLDIHLLAVGRRHVGREWNFQNINSYYNRLIWVRNGTVVLNHNGKSYEVEAGTVHLVPCYTSVDYLSNAGQADLNYIHFTSRALGGLDVCRLREYHWQREANDVDCFAFEQLLKTNPSSELPVVNPAIPLYRRYHENAQEHYHELDPGLHLQNMAYISLMLAPFLSTVDSTTATRGESRRMIEFATYVEDNLHLPFGLNEVATALGVNPNYLSDWLFRIIGTRPVDYITNRRIEEAQLLLISTDREVKEIAYQVGFSSPTYFARVFRKKLGVTASRYRRLQR